MKTITNWRFCSLSYLPKSVLFIVAFSSIFLYPIFLQAQERITPDFSIKQVETGSDWFVRLQANNASHNFECFWGGEKYWYRV